MEALIIAALFKVVSSYGLTPTKKLQEDGLPKEMAEWMDEACIKAGYGMQTDEWKITLWNRCVEYLVHQRSDRTMLNMIMKPKQICKPEDLQIEPPPKKRARK